MRKDKYSQIDLEVALCFLANFMQNDENAKKYFRSEYPSYIRELQSDNYSAKEIAELLANDFLGELLITRHKIATEEVSEKIKKFDDIFCYFSIRHSALFDEYCKKYRIGEIILHIVLYPAL